jgi:hypothetical protein
MMKTDANACIFCEVVYTNPLDSEFALVGITPSFDEVVG